MENIYFFLLRNTEPGSTKLGIEHPWVEEIQIFFQIKTHALLQGEIIAKIVKLHVY